MAQRKAMATTAAESVSEKHVKNFNILTEYCQGFPKLTIWFFRPVQKHLYKLSACGEQVLRHNIVKIHLINEINHGTNAT